VPAVAQNAALAALVLAWRRASAGERPSSASSPSSSTSSTPAPRILSSAELESRFGPLPWSPVDGDDSAITIDPTWAAVHLVPVDVPQLRDVPGAHGGRVTFHKDAAERLKSFFAAVEAAGLLDRLKSFDGSFAPRRVRGRTSVSRHAYAVAFDINASSNPLGGPPAALGEPGCVLELVPIAAAHGFAWGGNFKGGRPDPMHFEVAA
jgi:hypothetical protein